MSIYFLWLIIKGYPQKIEIGEQINDLKNKIDALKKEKERIKNLEEYFKSENYLEKQARLKLNLKKEGEGVIFIYKKEEGKGMETQKEESLFSRIKNIFESFLRK